jgi:succinate-semialdehyde dehydrogenase/glutarate-semialdehyde dehydrogenase
MGRTHGPYGMLEITNIKFVCDDFAKKRTKQWWYPYAPANLRIIESALAIMHHPSRGRKFKALLSLLPQLGTVNSTTPFRSLLKITSRLFHS